MAERDIAREQNSLRELIHSSQIIPQGIVVGKPISGGYASQVYEAELGCQPVIVKHTEDSLVDGTSLKLSRESIGTGAEVLERLQGTPGVRVPGLIAFDPGIATMVMEDIRADGYELMTTRLRQKHELPAGSARKAGLGLGHLVSASRQWGQQVRTTHTADLNMSLSTRGLVEVFGPDSPYVGQIMTRFKTQNQGWVWWDSTPKNMLVRDDGETAFIDFDSSCIGDRQNTLPMLMAHMAIWGLTEYIDRPQAIAYMCECIEAFKEIENIDEEAFCQYFAMEILGNARGQYTLLPLTGDHTETMLNFGKQVFEMGINRIDDLMGLISKC